MGAGVPVKGFAQGLLRLIAYLFALILFTLIVLLVMGYLGFRQLTSGVPSTEQLRSYHQNLSQKSKAPEPCYGQEVSLLVPVNEMPRHVVDAFLAAEDKTFYQREPVTYYSVVVMIYGDSESHSIGRSSITRSVARNILLRQERISMRRILQSWFALQIERDLTKDQILELYLTEINLGESRYGLSAASCRYFDKAAAQLTLEEAALLAALPKSPTRLNPRTHPDAALERRNWLLSQMATNGFITQAEADAAIARPIVLAPVKPMPSATAP